MTDIPTTTPITARRLHVPRPGFPRLGIGASLAAIFGLVGAAFGMAYVDPYSRRRREPQVGAGR